MGKKQQNIVILVVCLTVAAVAFYIIYKRKMVEGYNATSFSTITGLQRTPVTFTFRDNGMNNNPEYWAAPTDKHIPLEYGGMDFFQRPVTVIKNKPIHNNDVNFVRDENLGAPHHRPGRLDEYEYDSVTLVNDGKLRMDMVDSGEMGAFRILDNMIDDTHKTIPGEWRFEAQDCIKDVGHPLYASYYHDEEILGH